MSRCCLNISEFGREHDVDLRTPDMNEPADRRRCEIADVKSQGRPRTTKTRDVGKPQHTQSKLLAQPLEWASTQLRLVDIDLPVCQERRRKPLPFF